mmetsp:Transcript_59980/g.68201  ORF Transcript_59980/g.68201 Transcript_59980/m.68201 type:complete len:107 (+) Transcript_59980:1497-1817(+)
MSIQFFAEIAEFFRTSYARCCFHPHQKTLTVMKEKRRQKIKIQSNSNDIPLLVNSVSSSSTIVEFFGPLCNKEIFTLLTFLPNPSRNISLKAFHGLMSYSGSPNGG